MDQRDIGKFIASCRKNKEMTQSELAEKLGVSINAVSKWERGINLPDYSNLQELCSVLGISLNEFFAGRHLEDSEIERQSEDNLLSVVKQSELDRQRKKWDRAFKLVVLAIVIFAAGRFVLAMNGYVPALDRMYIKEYGTGTVGDVDTDYFLEKSPDFEIGANIYGYAVFKKPAKAMKRLKQDYAEGIALIQQEFDLRPLNCHTYHFYGNYGWQVTGGSEEARRQADFVTGFVDIYENRFR